MGMIFRFRALSDENDNFSRDYELRCDSDLLQFHRLICSDLGFDPEEMCSFFLSDELWHKNAEFTSLNIGAGPDEGAPEPMEGTLLATAIRKEKQRLIYTFDPFSGRSLFIELSGSFKEAVGETYPRVAGASGGAPAQFDIDALAPESSIFGEALGEFGDFEGDDYYDDDI